MATACKVFEVYSFVFKTILLPKLKKIYIVAKKKSTGYIMKMLRLTNIFVIIHLIFDIFH